MIAFEECGLSCVQKLKLINNELSLIVDLSGT